MQTRTCGATGLTLPLLGIGAWSFGGGAYWGAQDQAEVDTLVGRALDLGCTYFDTAEMYNDGASEEALGRALKGRRREALIGTKVRPLYAYPAALRAQCEASLRRLGTDSIDLYMLHWPLDLTSLRQYTQDPRLLASPPSAADAFATLEDLRREGKIRHVGLSNFGVRQLSEALATGAPASVNQLAYNLLTRAIETDILPFCRARGIGVMAYMPLLQGLLSGKFRTLNELPPQRTRTRHYAGTRPGARHGEPGLEAETTDALGRLAALAAAERVPLARLALAWVAAQPGISCVLAGARSVSQLEENVAGIDQALSPDLLRAMDEATGALKARWGANADLWENAANARIA